MSFSKLLSMLVSTLLLIDDALDDALDVAPVVILVLLLAEDKARSGNNVQTWMQKRETDYIFYTGEYGSAVYIRS